MNQNITAINVKVDSIGTCRYESIKKKHEKRLEGR